MQWGTPQIDGTQRVLGVPHPCGSFEVNKASFSLSPFSPSLAPRTVFSLFLMLAALNTVAGACQSPVKVWHSCPGFCPFAGQVSQGKRSHYYGKLGQADPTDTLVGWKVEGLWTYPCLHGLRWSPRQRRMGFGDGSPLFSAVSPPSDLLRKRPHQSVADLTVGQSSALSGHDLGPAIPFSRDPRSRLCPCRTAKLIGDRANG